MRRMWDALMKGWEEEGLLEELPRPSGSESFKPSTHAWARCGRVFTARAGIAVAAIVLVACGIALSAPLGKGAAASGPGSFMTNRDAVYAPSPFSWSAPELIDHQYPYSWPFGIDSISCASTTLCVGTTDTAGEILSSTDPGGTSSSDWSVLLTSLIAQDGTGYSLSGASCVTAGSGPFCVAAGRNLRDQTGNPGVILTSTDPTGGASAWQPALFPFGLFTSPACTQTGATTTCITAGEDYTHGNDAIYVSTNPAGGAASWPRITPQFTGAGYAVAGAACPSSSLCAALDYGGQFVASSAPTNPASWSTAGSTGLVHATSLSCPTTSFCIAAGTNASEEATIATTSDPQNGSTATWSTSTQSALVAYATVSCSPDSALPSPHAICLAGGSLGNVEVSTDGGATWTSQSLAPTSGFADAFACPASTLCVAGTTNGTIVNSANATSGASGTWSAPVPVAGGVSAVNITPQSCPSSSLCLASDGAGRVLTSTNPAGGVSTWSSSLVDPGGYGFSTPVCPSTTLCVATDGKGNLLTSTNPAGGGSSWSAPASIDANGAELELACPTEKLCVAVDAKGDVTTSTDPAGGASTWSAPTGIDSTGTGRLVCPSSTLCVAIDWDERMLVTTDPAGGASRWSAPASIGLAGLTGLACPSAGLCVATDYEGHLTTSANPAGGASTWSAPASIDSAGIARLQCPSSTLCVAIDWNNRMLASTNPSGGASTWSAPSSLGAYISQLDCPSSGLCLATGFSGDVLTSIDPSGGAFAWSAPTSVDPSGYINGIACPTSTLCVLSDNAGNVIVGTGLPAPSSTSPPTISGSAVAGQTLSESNGSWTNSPTSFAYQWQRCDTAGGNCQAIAGATAQTYVLGAADVGSTIRAQETASNAGGTGAPATSAATAVVQASSSGGGSGSGGSGLGGSSPPPPGAGSASVGGVNVGGSTVSELLSCGGAANATCELTVTLTVTETLKGGKLIAVSASKKKRPKVVKRTVTVGSASISLAGGASQLVKIELNTTGKRLLASHHKLAAQLTTTEAGAGGHSTLVSRRTVTFKVPAKRTRKGRKKGASQITTVSYTLPPEMR